MGRVKPRPSSLCPSNSASKTLSSSWPTTATTQRLAGFFANTARVKRAEKGSCVTRGAWLRMARKWWFATPSPQTTSALYQLVAFDRYGRNELRRFGSRGSNDSQFKTPSDLIINTINAENESELLVCDGGN